MSGPSRSIPEPFPIHFKSFLTILRPNFSPVFSHFQSIKKKNVKFWSPNHSESEYFDLFCLKQRSGMSQALAKALARPSRHSESDFLGRKHPKTDSFSLLATSKVTQIPGFGSFGTILVTFQVNCNMI